MDSGKRAESSSLERIRDLEAAEDQVVELLKQMGQCLVELSKDKPSQKQVTEDAKVILQLAEGLQNDLFGQIDSLFQAAPGVSFSKRKVFTHLERHNYDELFKRTRSVLDELDEQCREATIAPKAAAPSDPASSSQ